MPADCIMLRQIEINASLSQQCDEPQTIRIRFARVCTASWMSIWM
jgi:hypothetical protein